MRQSIVDAHSRQLASLGGGRFRMPVDRCFTLAGIGTVVTGTVTEGQIAVGEHVVVSPGGIKAHVRSIHAQNTKAEIAGRGDRCALNLVGSHVNRDAIARGDVIVDPALHLPTDRIDAYLRLLRTERRPLSHWAPVKLHHGTTEIVARPVILADGSLASGQDGFVQLVLDRPTAAMAGERFVIRGVSDQRAIGGGRFLDLRAPTRKRRPPQRIAQLHAHFETSPPATGMPAVQALAPPARMSRTVSTGSLPSGTPRIANAMRGFAPIARCRRSRWWPRCGRSRWHRPRSA